MKIQIYIVLNKNIADVVVILNEKGYTTVASCDGHVNEPPLIKFSPGVLEYVVNFN